MLQACTHLELRLVQLYFWARLAYVPLLVFGVPLVRSLAWNVASIGMLLVWSSLVIR